MKKLFIIIVSFLPLFVEGQKNGTSNRIIIGFNFSPDYDFRNLKNSDGSSSSDLVIKSRNDLELSKIGFTTGLDVLIGFSNTLEFETGIQFSNKGYKTRSQDLVFFPPNPSSPIKAKFVYSFQYLGIPIKLKGIAGKGRTRFTASAGFTTNYLMNIQHMTNLLYSDGKTEIQKESSTSGFNRIDLSPSISFGIRYAIHGNLFLIAEPTFNYGIIPTKDAPVKEHLWNGGLNIGLYYGIR